MTSEVVTEQRWPILGGLYFAVFNSTDYDRRVGRNVIVEMYGDQVWKDEICPTIRTGIMGLFKCSVTPARLTFAETVADSAERRAHRRRS